MFSDLTNLKLTVPLKGEHQARSTASAVIYSPEGAIKGNFKRRPVKTFFCGGGGRGWLDQPDSRIVVAVINVGQSVHNNLICHFVHKVCVTLLKRYHAVERGLATVFLNSQNEWQCRYTSSAGGSTVPTVFLPPEKEKHVAKNYIYKNYDQLNVSMRSVPDPYPFYADPDPAESFDALRELRPSK